VLLLTDSRERLRRALISLEGLSVGDAFGGMYFVEGAVEMAESRLLFAPEWDWTDDTLMALSVVESLANHKGIDPDSLAISFAAHYDDTRGYGPAMHRLLQEIGRGIPWQTAAQAQFGGQGSYGNGGAMRAAPIGAYFADDVVRAASEAARSTAVTHAHPEGVAGAIAIAVAAALAWSGRDKAPLPRAAFLEAVLPHVPESLVRQKIRQARDLPAEGTVRLAGAVLGTGLEISAPDTVPFALWCAAGYLVDYEEALWTTLSGMGDRDTTCAIVGGIVACRNGIDGIPSAWKAAREALPGWFTTVLTQQGEAS